MSPFIWSLHLELLLHVQVSKAVAEQTVLTSTRQMDNKHNYLTGEHH